jgi:hypothetical protein
VSYAFRWNNYKHPNLVAAFDFGTLTDDKTKIRNLSLRGSAYDATINGTYTPALPLIRSKKTPSMRFDGINNTLDLASPLNGLAAFSIIAVQKQSGNGMTLCRGGAGDSFIYKFVGNAVMEVFIGGGGLIIGKKIIDTEDHVIGISHANTDTTWYFEGRFIQRSQFIGVGWPVDATLKIGCFNDGSLKFSGDMDFMAFYNIKLTAEQHSSIYRSMVPR